METIFSVESSILPLAISTSKHALRYQVKNVPLQVFSSKRTKGIYTVDVHTSAGQGVPEEKYSVNFTTKNNKSVIEVTFHKEQKKRQNIAKLF
jgi:hypothetical protein